MTDDLSSEQLTFERNDDTLRGYAVWPSGEGPFPALIVIWAPHA